MSAPAISEAMSSTSTQAKEPIQVRFEGFWSAAPDKAPWPQPQSDSEWDTKDQRQFREALKRVQQRYPAQVSYLGSSECRLCPKDTLIGHQEFAMIACRVYYVWPSGYLHYLEHHKCIPTRAFQSWIRAIDRCVPTTNRWDPPDWPETKPIDEGAERFDAVQGQYIANSSTEGIRITIAQDQKMMEEAANASRLFYNAERAKKELPPVGSHEYDKLKYEASMTKAELYSASKWLNIHCEQIVKDWEKTTMETKSVPTSTSSNLEPLTTCILANKCIEMYKPTNNKESVSHLVSLVLSGKYQFIGNAIYEARLQRPSFFLAAHHTSEVLGEFSTVDALVAYLLKEDDGPAPSYIVRYNTKGEVIDSSSVPSPIHPTPVDEPD
jgi:hypothetical protein